MTPTDGQAPNRDDRGRTDLPVHEQLRARAAQEPARAALTDGTRVLTLGALDERLDAIAAQLSAHGVAPGARVVLHTERSLDVVVVLLAIHRAGAAYVPIDPELPCARVAMLLEDADAALVVTDRALPVPTARPVIELATLLAAPPATAPTRRGVPDDPAHVIFTSGSTGRPKGVAVGQRALAAFVDAVNEHYGIAPTDRVLQFSSLSFDGSVQEIFVPLAHGATVVVPPRPLLGAAGWVVDELDRLGITWMAMPTSAWHALATDLDLAGCTLPPRLHTVMVGGEAARPDVVRRWHEGAGRGRRLINSYGPTEVTVAAVVTELPPGVLRDGEPVPIGVPLAGVRALVVDADDRPVAAGAIGELLLGGPQLADGYLGRPDLTAARFVPDPTGADAVVYRTGDRVRTRDDGLLVFEGRVDDQVKIRGFRIELAEVDGVFAAHPAVVEAVTVVDRTPDDARLAVFVVIEPEVTVSVAALREHAVRLLPAYAVPPTIEVCEAIPRTSGHKPDRAALRDRLASERARRAPLTFAQERMWLREQLDAGTQTYLELFGRRLRGPLDVTALHDAVAVVVARHEPLRTRFVRTPDGPVQEIDAYGRVAWEVRDLGHVAPAERDAVLGSVYASIAHRPIDVGQGPLCEWLLVRLAPDDHALLVRVHHLVIDGPSVDLLLGELFTVYEAGREGRPADLAPLLTTYRDFAARQRAQAAAGEFDDDLAWWTDALAALPRRVPLPEDRVPGGGAAPSAGSRLELALPDDFDERLTARARAWGTTRHRVGLALLVAFLYEETGADDLLLAMPGTERLDASLEPLVGLFVNTLPLRVRVHRGDDLVALAARVRDRTAEVLAHRAVPLDLVLGALRARGEVLPDPLFSVIFEHRPLRRTDGVVRAGLQISRVPKPDAFDVGAKFPLSAVVERRPAGSALIWVHDTARFSDAAAARLAERFVSFACAALDDPTRPLVAGERPVAPVHDPVLDPVAPVGAAEAWGVPVHLATVRSCFAEVLGREVGEDADFFASGGHSLLAVRLCSAIERAVGARLALAAVFDAPTPRALAAVVDRATGVAPAGPGSARASAADPDAVHARPTRLWLDRAPASFAQRRMWLLEARGGLGDAYLLVTALEIDGPLDLVALRAAARRTAHRHDVLRTRLVEGIGGVLEQVVDPEPQDIVEVIERPDATADAAACLAAAHGRVRRSFDLGRDHPWRIVVVPCGREQHVVAIVVHHVATDGVSQGLLRGDLDAAYVAAVTGAEAPAPPRLQYGDHAVWQHAARARGALDASLAELVTAMSPVPEPLQLPSTRRRPLEATGPGALVVRSLDDELLGRVDRCAVAWHTTRHVVLLTAYEILLHRLTGRRELVVGVPVTERASGPYESTMGFFVNTAALRSVLDDDVDARDAARATHRALHEAIRHADVPFDLVVDALGVVAEPGLAPLVQTMFSVQTGEHPTHFGGLRARPVREPRSARAKFDLSLIVDLGPDPRLLFEHRTDVLDTSRVEEWAARYVDVLRTLVDRPDARPWDLPMVDDEARRALGAAAPTGASYPREATVHELVAEVARRRRDEVAIVDGAVTRTYGELMADAGALAARLRAEGARPGARVSIELPRSADLVVAVLAVLACGATYVPIDPTYPAPRRALLQELAAPVVSVGRDIDGALAVRATGHEPHDTIVATGALAPAYVMFTSGSTGRPKGVVVPHRAIVRLVRDTDYVAFGPEVVMAHLSNTSFDAATFEIWGALCNGGRLVVLDVDTATSPRALAAAVRDHGITTMFLTTALFNAVANEEPASFAGVRDLLVGGEEADAAAVRRVLAHGAPARLLNAYGPTESTTFAAWHLVGHVPDDATRVPIGGPLANTTLYVVDRRGQLVPTLVEGELWIGGDGLALGYLDDDELTAQRFVPDPFSPVPGARVYRTGDLVRRLADGAIEFVGRIDDQVKVRGFRVEPGEIEAVARGCHGVALAHVLVRRDDDGVASLHLFVVPLPGIAVDAAVVREALVAQLPAALVPETIVVLDELPMTANGKVDRDELLRLVRLAAPASRTAPCEASSLDDPFVHRLVALWRDALDEPSVGPDDDFFRIGGTSIRAVRVIAALERDLGARVGLSSLFLAPTPRALAALVRDRLPGDAPGPGTPRVAEGEPLLVPLRPPVGATDVVLCCIHPAGGELFSYAPLARLLPHTVEVLGVREHGWGARRPVFTRIEDYAERYASEIHAARPTGRLVLAGHSLGGLLAFETARCLGARGRTVDLVVLLDAIVLDPPSLLERPSWLWHRRVLGSRARLRDGWARRRAERAGRPVDPLLLGRESERRGRVLQERYRPGHHEGPVLCIRACGLGPEPTPDTFTHRWVRVAPQLEVVEVVGEHTGDASLLAPRFAPDVAAVLGRALGPGIGPRGVGPYSARP